MRRTINGTKRVAIALAAILSLVLVLAAGALAEIPDYAGPVNDTNNTLNPKERQTLTKILQDYNNAGSNPISVLILDSTAPQQMADFLISLVGVWEKTKPGVATGGVILVVAMRDGRLQINVGTRLKDSIRQEDTQKILNEVITPRFRRRQFGEGIIAGARALIELTGGAVPAEEPEKRDLEEDDAEGSGKAGSGNLRASASSIIICLAASLIVGAIARTIVGPSGGMIAAGVMMYFACGYVIGPDLCVVFGVMAALCVLCGELFIARTRYSGPAIGASRDSLDQSLGGASGIW